MAKTIRTILFFILCHICVALDKLRYGGADKLPQSLYVDSFNNVFSAL